MSYNVKDHWREIVKDIAPPNRHQHTMVAYKHYLVVFGGCLTRFHVSLPSTPLADLWIFDIKANTWYECLPKADRPRPTARYAHSATLVNDMMVVVGGTASGESAIADDHFWLLDLNATTLPLLKSSCQNRLQNAVWYPVPFGRIDGGSIVVEPMHGHTALLHNGDLLLVGGIKSSYRMHGTVFEKPVAIPRHFPLIKVPLNELFQKLNKHLLEEEVVQVMLSCDIFDNIQHRMGDGLMQTIASAYHRWEAEKHSTDDLKLLNKYSKTFSANRRKIHNFIEKIFSKYKEKLTENQNLQFLIELVRSNNSWRSELITYLCPSPNMPLNSPIQTIIWRDTDIFKTELRNDQALILKLFYCLLSSATLKKDDITAPLREFLMTKSEWFQVLDSPNLFNLSQMFPDQFISWESIKPFLELVTKCLDASKAFDEYWKIFSTMSGQHYFLVIKRLTELYRKVSGRYLPIKQRELIASFLNKIEEALKPENSKSIKTMLNFEQMTKDCQKLQSEEPEIEAVKNAVEAAKTAFENLTEEEEQDYLRSLQQKVQNLGKIQSLEKSEFEENDFSKFFGIQEGGYRIQALINAGSSAKGLREEIDICFAQSEQIRNDFEKRVVFEMKSNLERLRDFLNLPMEEDDRELSELLNPSKILWKPCAARLLHMMQPIHIAIDGKIKQLDHQISYQELSDAIRGFGTLILKLREAIKQQLESHYQKCIKDVPNEADIGESHMTKYVKRWTKAIQKGLNDTVTNVWREIQDAMAKVIRNPIFTQKDASLGPSFSTKYITVEQNEAGWFASFMPWLTGGLTVGTALLTAGVTTTTPLITVAKVAIPAILQETKEHNNKKIQNVGSFLEQLQQQLVGDTLAKVDEEVFDQSVNWLRENLIALAKPLDQQKSALKAAENIYRYTRTKLDEWKSKLLEMDEISFRVMTLEILLLDASSLASDQSYYSRAIETDIVILFSEIFPKMPQLEVPVLDIRGDTKRRLQREAWMNDLEAHLPDFTAPLKFPKEKITDDRKKEAQQCVRLASKIYEKDKLDLPEFMAISSPIEDEDGLTGPYHHVWKKERDLFIVFRGSVDGKDWLHNFTSRLISSDANDHDAPAFHTGFTTSPLDSSAVMPTITMHLHFTLAFGSLY
eukprot:TRINITY_DN2585_c0_g1_i12.p1 TRINITY_DN2585_c0_g1~~TRINITY_DN2585_c0_g1_i12.p1  ORF type:complete len:1131 (+),score=276.90 TRINITY_DN2585_c0_g1_i12:1336-4728(+)